MDLSTFFASYPGLYVTQSFFHSLVASAVVEIAIITWNVRSPSVRQRFSLIVVVSPIVLFPAYQFVNPARTSLSFRLGALFDSSRWLNLEVLGAVPLGAVLALVFLVTTLVFLLQELVPIARDAVASKPPDDPVGVRQGEDMTLRMALEQLPVEAPETHVLDDEDLVIFSTTGKRGAIYLSSGLLSVLTVEQLQAALAHEIAHVLRSRRPFLILVFLLRSVMFFNPIVLVGFRRTVQEDEKICDEIAVSLTKKPSVLADTLRKLYVQPEEPGEQGEGTQGKVMDRLERYSHQLNIRSRIARLEGTNAFHPGGEGVAFALTLLVVIALNYYVV